MRKRRIPGVLPKSKATLGELCSPSGLFPDPADYLAAPGATGWSQKQVRLPSTSDESLLPPSPYPILSSDGCLSHFKRRCPLGRAGGLTLSKLPQRAATISLAVLVLAELFKILLSCLCPSFLSDVASICPGGWGAFRDSSLLGPPRLPNAGRRLRRETEDEEEHRGKGKGLCPCFTGSFRLGQTIQRGQKLARFLLCSDRLAGILPAG